MYPAFFAFLAGILLSVNLVNSAGIVPLIAIYSVPVTAYSAFRLARAFDRQKFLVCSLVLLAGIGGIVSGALALRSYEDIPRPDFNGAPVAIESQFTITGFPDIREITPGGKIEYAVRAGNYTIVSADAGNLYPSAIATVYGTLYAYGNGGTVYANPGGIVLNDAGFAPLSAVSALRNRAAEQFVRTGNPVTRALLFSLIMGNRTFMSYADMQSFRMSGIIHLLALSGLHIGIISMGIVLILKRFMRENAAYLISAFAVIIYMTLGGMGPSLLRAGIMFVLYTFLRGIGRKPDFIDILLFSAFALLLIDPLLARNIGFVLSYVSTAAIVLLSGRVRDLLGLRGYYGGILAGTLAANTVTLPFLFYYFDGASVIAPLTNLLVIPVFGVVLGMVFLHFILSLFGIYIVEIAIDTLWTGIAGFSDILTRPGFVYLRVGGFDWISLTVSLALIGGIFFFYPRIRYRALNKSIKSAQ
ncbi:MAG: ComEC/Rec2 family competence protein [Brevinematales bacterium]|nr:ComEC/Rec2 family competence protein [Brevinematales bacterium]